VRSRLLPSLPPDPEHQPSPLAPVQLIVQFEDGDPGFEASVNAGYPTVGEFVPS
jgi:hypothetical protein